MSYQANKKWRLNHPKIRYQGKKRYYQKFQGAYNHRQRWTNSHINLALAHVIPDSELSELIGRSLAAIQKARWFYGGCE